MQLQMAEVSPFEMLPTFYRRQAQKHERASSHFLPADHRFGLDATILIDIPMIHVRHLHPLPSVVLQSRL